ncbi:MAG: C-GCAxxG-C-C family protein [Bacteroidota bacterium]|nr:C-GCAxxG-C-C family protein [Bacteroidota bacterium]
MNTKPQTQHNTDKKKAEIDPYITQSKKLLFSTLNCCESQIIPFQNANDMDDELLLKAVTGLAGGLYNRGSTCGVVLGAAIDLALLKNKTLGVWTPGDQLSLLNQVADYVNWFEEEFEGCLCRDRVELDFQTIRGKVGLLFPKKARGCVKQSALSMKYLLDEKNIINHPKTCSAYKHCATDVLKIVRKKTGRGADTIEQLSTVFDGGIGLSGGGCGALIGGLIALGLRFGYEHSKQTAFKRSDIFRTIPRHYSKVANQLIDQFKAKYGALECVGITGEKIDGFESFLEQRENCQSLIEWVAEKASE